MNQVTIYKIDLSAAQSTVTPFYADKYDQLLIEIPAVTGVFASSPVAITLRGSPRSGGTARDLHYYDYVENTPNTCVVTVSTGGIYEFPNPGSINYIGISTDVATSQATSVYLMAPKTTY